MKLRLFIDTNVMIDLLAKRQPWYDDALMLFSLIYDEEYTGVVAPISYSTASYVLGKKLKFDELSKILRDFSSFMEISELNDTTVKRSIDASSTFTDIEDAMQYHSAIKSNCDIIITRNVNDFKGAEIPYLLPKIS